jgi:hypothetical protein
METTEERQEMSLHDPNDMPRSMLEKVDVEAQPERGISPEGATEGATTTNEDLPNLAPTKSMDFPDGMTSWVVLM